MRLRRASTAVVAALSAVPLVFVAGVPAAVAADPDYKFTSTMSDSEPMAVCESRTRIKITSADKTSVFTHALATTTISPGGTASKTISNQTTLTVAVDLSTTVSASADAVIAAASAATTFSLNMTGSKSLTTSFTQSQTNSTNVTRRYIWFRGATKVTGNYARQVLKANCTWETYSSGSWRSFWLQADGVIDCNKDDEMASRFGYYSLEAKAARKC
jgi:hypothetical protein